MRTETMIIHDLAYGGDGVGRGADGRAIFVPYTIPGEEVEVEIVQEKKRFCRGRLKELLTPSEFRVAPECPLFGRCGGCQYQHIAYSEQVRFKCTQLTETLRRLGGVDVPGAVDPVIVSPEEYSYRNKLTLEPFERDGNLDYGFFSHLEGDFLSIDHCPLADSAINDLLREARPAAEAAKPGTRYLLLRHASRSKARMFPEKPASRADWLTEEVGGRSVKVPSHSFWQVNSRVGAALAEAVMGLVRDTAPRILIDAYAGVGFFSLVAGSEFERVVVIETDHAAIKASRWNHRHFGLKGRVFIAGRTEKILPEHLKHSGKDRQQTLVLLDPPRGGCDSRVCEALCSSPVSSIMYISCNPTSLARDLKQLVGKGGYQVERLGLADMFPQTAHVESFVLLRNPKCAETLK